MTYYWKAISGLLVAVFLGLSIEKKGLGALLTAAVCVMAAVTGCYFLSPLVALMKRIQQVASVSDEVLTILMKVLGVGILTEIMDGICRESGMTSLAKSAQLLGSAVIFWLSIPVLESLLSVIQQILEKI